MNKELVTLPHLADMDEMSLMVKLFACQKGGNQQSYNEARNELIRRGNKIEFSFEKQGACS
ncbi:MAG: hypothetical protein WCG01_05265 [bacterium]